MKKILLIILFIPFLVKADYTKSVIDINDLSIKEIQEYVDKGYLTYELIARLYLDRINEYNEMYNAIITVNNNIIEEAKKKDIEYKNSGRTSLIFGLPFIVKDNIDVKGLPTTSGTKALLDSFPYENALSVDKLIKAGALVIGKSNMDEFAFNANVSKSSFGYTYNAYDISLSSYGSSGGSAVSVAANLAVFALGTDTGCSIRVPSSANGVVGIRPTYDLVSTDGVIKFESLRDTVGVISKYVTDNAIVLDILDDKDIDYLENTSDNLKGVTIGVIKGFMNPNTSSTSMAYGKTEKYVYDMMNNSINILENLGAKIVYLDNFYLNYKFDASNMCYLFNEYIKNTSSKIKSLDDLVKDGRFVSYIGSYNGYYCNNDYTKTSAYTSYVNNRNNNINIANNRFDTYNLDAIIYPTIKNELLNMNDLGRKIYTPSSDTAPLIGFPAITIPMGVYNNMPYGLEIMAKANNEAMLYKIALNYEDNNKVYKTPSIAPSLYTVNEDVSKLINYYEKYKYNEIYKQLNEETLNFFKNYKDEDLNILIDKYENFKYEETNNVNTNKLPLLVCIIISLVGILIILKRRKK